MYNLRTLLKHLMGAYPRDKDGACSGAVLVEFTLVLPMLIILSLGTAEFGRAMHHYLTIEKGVRDAARYLSRVEIDCPNSPGAGTIDNPADMVAAQNLALTGYISGAQPIISYWTNTSSVTLVPYCVPNGKDPDGDNLYRGDDHIPIIRVTANVGYQDLGFLSILGFDPLVFSLSHEELNIGE